MCQRRDIGVIIRFNDSRERLIRINPQDLRTNRGIAAQNLLQDRPVSAIIFPIERRQQRLDEGAERQPWRNIHHRYRAAQRVGIVFCEIHVTCLHAKLKRTGVEKTQIGCEIQLQERVGCDTL